MKKTIIGIFLIFLLIFLTSIYILESKKAKDIGAYIEEVLEEREEIKIPEKEEVIEEKTYRSPLSGLTIDQELVDRRIIGIMYDDHPRARWQAGLNQAELVYEIPVETPYTRYLAFFFMGQPEKIGPIRSSRPYFVTKILEYNSIYVRVGGSDQAKADIINYKIEDIDGLTSPANLFYRDRNKRAPNNLYTSMDKILEEMDRKNFKKLEAGEFFLFNREDTDPIGYDATGIFIDYGGGNTSEYFYHEGDRLYSRYKDKKLHIDEVDQSQIQIKNIIIQYASIRTIDNEGRKSIELVGEGRAMYFTNGRGKDINWKKEGRQAPTKYYDLNGEEIYLNQGNTWINIVDSNMDIIIK